LPVNCKFICVHFFSDSSDDEDWEIVLNKASDQNHNQDVSKEWLESSIEGRLRFSVNEFFKDFNFILIMRYACLFKVL